MANLQPSSIELVLSQVRGRFQRASSAWDAYATSNVESWLDDLCRQYPWWFLTTNPGTLLRASFPISALNSLPTRAGSWVDIGWLRVSPGVQVYDIYAPTSETTYYTTPTDGTNWHLANCQELRYVYEFDKDGNFIQDLDIQDDVSALTFMGYTTRQRPCQAMWRTLENRSQLIFDPVPDDYYLYAVSFTEANVPIFSTDSGASHTHKFINVLPEALVQYGIIKAAQYFDEPDIAAQAKEALFGNPPNLHLPRSKKMVNGLLDTLRNDTTKRQTQFEQEKMLLCRSKNQASGRYGNSDSLTMHQKYWDRRYRRSIY